MKAQEILKNIGNKVNRVRGTGSVIGQGSDSLRHRNKFEDSITIYYSYLNRTNRQLLDSTIDDFVKRYPIPATSIYLGNTGNATKSLLFSPKMQAGFDAGFHAFDNYILQADSVKFYNTTRPYSEINYQLASRAEQIIDLVHTQNIKPDWNVAVRYRLINAPGFFKSQKTNHNNYLFNSLFASHNRRYKNYFIIMGNSIQSGENGGMIDTINYLNHPNKAYNDRFNIPTKIGGDADFSTNFFSTKIPTGNKYSLFAVYLRQQYDLGKKDSIVSDSTIIPLFYPRIRFEHSFSYNRNQFVFEDNRADSVYYKTYYDTTLAQKTDTFHLQEKWKILTNDFSIYQFPDSKNIEQYIKLGITIQNLVGEFSGGKNNFYNLSGHATYRNKTKNQLWDIEADGRLYFTGMNAGDYQASISLQRLLSNKIGSLQLGFENTSRTPSTIYDSRSSFYLMKTPTDFKKENNTHLFASYILPSFRLKLSGHYYLMNNYTYITNYFELNQESTLFNVLQIALQKTFKIGKHWNWHADVYFQQVVGNAPVHIPAIFTRHRIAYEGNLGFKNLHIAMGAELKYRSNYKADNYSPVLGQYFYQDSLVIKNRLPDIAAYINFRIRPFKAFIRAENLNTARFAKGFAFTGNNLIAPGYALPGLVIRVGVYWSFVN